MLHTIRQTPSLLLLCIVSSCLALLMPAAQAQEAQNSYQQEVARCHATPGIDLEACLKEAAAAAKASRDNTLSDPAANTRERNLTSRCDAYTGSARDECLRLMRNGDIETLGSVESGGILRRMTIPVPATGS
ncbi:hypothetical protein [Castellaniella sp.]|uniref:hypothetical protein n=1 Tax=Castellaniella sp. TaxID=1955812 RepID=UPI0035685140